jgi:hypothetical protein
MNQESRQDRQRMGTTLVMAFAHDQEMYAAHVGIPASIGLLPTVVIK